MIRKVALLLQYAQDRELKWKVMIFLVMLFSLL